MSAAVGYRIVIWAYLDARAAELIRASLPNDQLHFVPFARRHHLEPADHAALREAEVVFGTLPPALLPGCPKLRWMQLESVGFDYYRDLSPRPAFPITNLRGMFDKPAAETALAGVLALARGVPRLVLAQSAGAWVELEVRRETWLLHDRRVVVLGAGAIGRRVQRLFEAFDCRVEMFARTSPGATLRTIADVITAVAKADIVVCCLPKTVATIGLVSRAVIEAMPSSAIFVNIGRGAVVDEQALAERLLQQRLKGAVIDVTQAEPLPPESPLWRCPNTLLTQHTAGGYVDELVDKAKFFLQNLAAFRAGQPVASVIDLERGY